MKVLLIFSMVTIILLEVPRLVREKFWRELGTFAVIMIMAYTLAFLEVFGVNY